MAQSVTRATPNDLVGAPELVLGLGLPLAALVTAGVTLAVPPTLGRALVPAALIVLGVVTLVAAYGLVMPLLASLEIGGRWVSERYGDVIRRPLRGILLGVAIALSLALGAVLFKRFVLPPAELCHPAAASLRVGPLALVLGVALGLVRWGAGRGRVAQRALFGGSHEGYLRIWGVWVAAPTLLGLVALAGYFAVRPAAFAALDEAGEHLEQLLALPEESIEEYLERWAEPLPEDDREQTARVLLDAVSCQPRARASVLAERLLGPDGVLAGELPQTPLRRQAVALLRRRPWNVVDERATRVGAIGPGDAQAAVARMEAIRGVREERAVLGWAAAGARCSEQLRTDKLPLWQQERAWLYHLLCARDTETAVTRHGEWLEQRLPGTPLDVGSWSALGEDWRYRRVRQADWPTVEKLAQSAYASALEDAEQIDARLFGAEPRPVRGPCNPKWSGAVLHLWRPLGGGAGTAWLGAVARLPKTLRSRGGRGDQRRWILTVYRRAEGASCPAGWSGPAASPSDWSTIGHPGGSGCSAPADLDKVCSFPAVVVEPAMAPDSAGAGAGGAAAP